MEFNPHLEVVLATIIWGSAGVFIKYLNLPPTVLSFFRMAVPTLILLVFFAIKRTKLLKGNIKSMLFASSLNAFRIIFYFIGFTYTSISNAIIVLYTWPIFATIYSMLFLKEKITKKNIFLLLTAFVGVILIYLNQELSFANKDFVGMTAILVCAAVYPLTVVIFKKESKRYSKFEIIFYQNLVGVFVFLPFLFISRPLPTLTQTAVSIFYTALVGIGGYALFFSALKRIKASAASAMCYLEIVSAILFGIILLHEVLTWNMILGGSLIVVSTILMKKGE